MFLLAITKHNAARRLHPWPFFPAGCSRVSGKSAVRLVGQKRAIGTYPPLRISLNVALQIPQILPAISIVPAQRAIERFSRRRPVGNLNVHKFFPPRSGKIDRRHSAQGKKNT